MIIHEGSPGAPAVDYAAFKPYVNGVVMLLVCVRVQLFVLCMSLSWPQQQSVR